MCGRQFEDWLPARLANRGSNAQKPAGASQAPKRLVRRAKSAIKAKVERPLKGKGGVAAEEARGGTGRKQETR